MSAFEELSLPVNIAIFTGAACVVWAAGTRLSAYADAIGQKTGLGQAILGLLLLGAVTSLPEVAVTASASLRGNMELAVNNIFGGVAMQVAILVLADLLIGRRALTAVVPDPVVMLQGSLMILMLAVAAAGIVAGDIPYLGIGVWVWIVLGIYVASIWLLSRERGRRPWLVAEEGKVDVALLKASGESGANEEEAEKHSLSGVITRASIAGAVIFVAGYLLAGTGEAIAQQTGLGSSFAGFVLVAISTSLPEVSTVFAAARLGLYTMAVSDIFGTNLFDVVLLFLVDALAAGDAALNTVGPFAAFGAILGIIVAVIYIAGLAERRDKSLLRLGPDSIAVMLAYLGGLVVLFNLR